MKESIENLVKQLKENDFSAIKVKNYTFDATAVDFYSLDDLMQFCKSQNVNNVFYSKLPDNEDNFVSCEFFASWNGVLLCYSANTKSIDDEMKSQIKADFEYSKALSENDNSLEAEDNYDDVESSSSSPKITVTSEQKKIIENLLSDKENTGREILDYYNEHCERIKGKKVCKGLYVQFLESKGLSPSAICVYSYKAYENLYRIACQVSQLFSKQADKEFFEELMSFVDVCVKENNQKKKLTKTEIDMFFMNHNLEATQNMKDIFRTKVNEKLGG
ncbi:MAG: hypothetical protein IJP90_05375 [Treponema sp.]|nr:hypothetical protein [Treponema sp.]